MTDVHKKLEDLRGALESAKKSDTVIGRFLNARKGFNLFRALRIDQFEIRHSNMIGWLLDPHETHNLGSLVLQGFLAQVQKLKSDFCINYLTPEDWNGFGVLREEDHKDIQISSEKAKIVVVIENKWNAAERVSTEEKEGQLKTYLKTIEGNSKYEGWQKAYVFLTPNGILPSEENADFWTPMGYRDLVDVLEGGNIQDTLKQGDIYEQKVFIEHYLKVIETRSDVMKKDDPVVLECLTLYRENREVFECVRSIVDDRKKWLFDRARNAMNNAICKISQATEGKIYLCDIPNGKYPSFHSCELDKYLPPNKDKRGSWNNGSGANYYYWFKIDQDSDGKVSVGLCFEFGGFTLQEESAILSNMKNLYKCVMGNEYEMYFTGGKKKGRRTCYHQTWKWGIKTERQYDLTVDTEVNILEEWASGAVGTAVEKETELINKLLQENRLIEIKC